VSGAEATKLRTVVKESKRKTREEDCMNCADFHKQLPMTIESGGDVNEQEHLRSCTNCSDLVRDLRYIAEQAKLLLPMHDPSPRVWNNIQASLQKEGLSRADRSPRSGQIASAQKKKEWPALGWAAVLAASLLIAIALVQFGKQNAAPKEFAQATTQSQIPASLDQFQSLADDDSQLLSEVEQRSPSLKSIYESNLKNVNNYISDARSSVESDPSDSEARQHLREAYAQKAMLYEMATARSLQ
jgi:hypothetical protein